MIFVVAEVDCFIRSTNSVTMDMSMPRKNKLVKAAISLLEADEENIRQAMVDMIREEKLVMEQEAIYLSPFYHSECGSAKRLLTLLGASDNGKSILSLT